MKELVTAIRQYRHNDGTGLLIAYDKEEIERIFLEVKYALHNEITSRLDTELLLSHAREGNKKLQEEIDRLNFVINNRKAISIGDNNG